MIIKLLNEFCNHARKTLSQNVLHIYSVNTIVLFGQIWSIVRVQNLSRSISSVQEFVQQ